METNRLNKYLTADEIYELASKGAEFLEKFEKQQKGDVYQEANFMYNRTQLKQMEKAADKYPEPLNHESWTSGELVTHAFEELVDQSHYLTTISHKFLELEKEIATLKEQANYWRNRYRASRYLYESEVPDLKGGKN